MPSLQLDEDFDPKPLYQSGSLDGIERIITSTPIGLEFPNIDLVELMEKPNSDTIIRDLAILLAERGVIMFRKQDRLTSDKHRELIDRLSKLGGRPKGNGLIRHALHAVYGDPPEVSCLTPERLTMRFSHTGDDGERSTRNWRKDANLLWHRDHGFENNPAGLSSLRLEQLPLTGGDTMFASSYELYDRLGPAFQKMFENMTSEWQDSDMTRSESNPKLYTGPRGAPKNVGFGVPVSHPCVRTHPITGFKSLHCYGLHWNGFNDVSTEENEILTKYVESLITKNHDLQVRMSWRNPGDILIWDNRCVMHCVTNDVVGKRLGFRVLSAGEKPYFDPNSKSRAQQQRSIKAKYEELLAQAKTEGKDVEGEYENGKQTNGTGKSGVNVVSLDQVLTALAIDARSEPIAV